MVMKMDAGLDTGDVALADDLALAEHVSIVDAMTTGEFTRKSLAMRR